MYLIFISIMIGCVSYRTTIGCIQSISLSEEHDMFRGHNFENEAINHPLSINELKLCDHKSNIILSQAEECSQDVTCLKCAHNYDAAVSMTKIFDDESATIRRWIRDKFDESVPIILMTVNDGQFYLFKNFVMGCDHFLSYDIRDRLVLLATDDKVLQKAEHMGVHVLSKNETIPGFDISSKYDKTTANSGPHKHINNLLFLMTNLLIHMDYNILMSDVDMVFLNSPFEYLKRITTNYDFSGMFAHYKHSKSPINTGFVYFNPTTNSKMFMQTIVNALPLKKHSDQWLFNSVLKHHLFETMAFRVLPLKLFGKAGSTKYFDKSTTYVYHAVSLNKEERLKKMGLWFLFN